MKKVLWISRHCMTVEQLEDLKCITGEEVEIIPWKDTVYCMSEIEPFVQRADIIAAVLPLELLAKLLEISGEKKVIQSVADRIPTGKMRMLEGGRMEEELRVQHKYWQQIMEIHVKTKRL